jgi:hypothetical protein
MLTSFGITEFKSLSAKFITEDNEPQVDGGRKKRKN